MMQHYCRMTRLRNLIHPLINLCQTRYRVARFALIISSPDASAMPPRNDSRLPTDELRDPQLISSVAPTYSNHWYHYHRANRPSLLLWPDSRGASASLRFQMQMVRWNTCVFTVLSLLHTIVVRLQSAKTISFLLRLFVCTWTRPWSLSNHILRASGNLLSLFCSNPKWSSTSSLQPC
jgi:hypothetical protein